MLLSGLQSAGDGAFGEPAQDKTVLDGQLVRAGRQVERRQLAQQCIEGATCSSARAVCWPMQAQTLASLDTFRTLLGPDEQAWEVRIRPVAVWVTSLWTQSATLWQQIVTPSGYSLSGHRAGRASNEPEGVTVVDAPSRANGLDSEDTTNFQIGVADSRRAMAYLVAPGSDEYIRIMVVLDRR